MKNLICYEIATGTLEGFSSCCSRVVVNRKGIISAFGRNFWFRLVQKHFGNILPFGRKKILAERDHFGWNYLSFGRNILLLASNLSEYFGRKTSFRPKLALSAEIRSFGKFLLSAKIAAFQISSFGFGRNSFGWPLFKRDPNIEGRRIKKQRIIRKAIWWAVELIFSITFHCPIVTLVYSAIALLLSEVRIDLWGQLEPVMGNRICS